MAAGGRGGEAGAPGVEPRARAAGARRSRRAPPVRTGGVGRRRLRPHRRGGAARGPAPAAGARSARTRRGAGSRVRPTRSAPRPHQQHASLPTFPHRTRRKLRRGDPCPGNSGPRAAVRPGEPPVRCYRAPLDGGPLRPHASDRPERSRRAARGRDRRGRVPDRGRRRRDRRQLRLGPAPHGVRDRPPPGGRVPPLPVRGRRASCWSGSISGCGSPTACCASASSRRSPASPCLRRPSSRARAGATTASRPTRAWPPAPPRTRRRRAEDAARALHSVWTRRDDRMVLDQTRGVRVLVSSA